MHIQLAIDIHVLRYTLWFGRRMQGWIFLTYSIFQVCVVLKTSDAVNVALGKPAYQTDTYHAYRVTADRAVDGNSSSDLMRDESCTHTSSVNVSWWVNLQQIFLIRSVTIYNRNAFSYRLTHVELYVGFSEHGFQAREGFHPGQIGASYMVSLTEPVYGQWVRITRNPPVEQLTLCEVEVEGIPYSKADGIRYSIFQGYIDTGPAIDVFEMIKSKFVCASRCSKTETCISAHYNTVTLTCSLFDSLEIQQGDVEYDVTLVNSIAITEKSWAQLLGH